MPALARAYGCYGGDQPGAELIEALGKQIIRHAICRQDGGALVIGTRKTLKGPRPRPRRRAEPPRFVGELFTPVTGDDLQLRSGANQDQAVADTTDDHLAPIGLQREKAGGCCARRVCWVQPQPPQDLDEMRKVGERSAVHLGPPHHSLTNSRTRNTRSHASVRLRAKAIAHHRERPEGASGVQPGVLVGPSIASVKRAPDRSAKRGHYARSVRHALEVVLVKVRWLGQDNAVGTRAPRAQRNAHRHPPEELPNRPRLVRAKEASVLGPKKR